MRGVELGLAYLRRGFRPEPARGHEVERLGQSIGELAVALSLRRVADEIQVPGMDPVQIGIAALGKRAQQVEGRGRLTVGLDHPLRVGLARGLIKIKAVDDVAAVGGQRGAVARLGLGRARLGKLPGEPAELDHRAAGAKGQHHRHLQQHLEHVADVVGVELGEALGAIAALEQKGFAAGHRGEPLFEPPCLAGKYERRKIVQGLLDPLQRALIRISWHLPDRQAAPAVGGPFLGHSNVPPHIPCRDFAADLIMFYLLVGGRSTFGDIRVMDSQKCESRLGCGRLRENAVARS